MNDLSFDAEHIIEFLTGLLNTPSPTGYHTEAIVYVERAFRALGIEGLSMKRLPKGALVITWAGESDNAPRGLTAHIDTLGFMVKEIKSNGRLRLSMLGSYMWNAVEFEGVTVQTYEGQHYRGTILPVKASVHIHRDARDLPRAEDTMEVRLDAKTSNADETRALGIEVGDFVFVDPRVEITDTGFIRSRHLDDKAGVAAIYGACQALQAAGLRPTQTVTVVIANYEEVGHGATAGFPVELQELISVDMAAVGNGQNSDEFSVGICVKDGGGPYDIDLIRKLRTLADQAQIPYKLDIYPFYASDGEAYWQAGGAAQVALIGPGVDASHAYE
ncbi:MAG TPA: M42 family metallopeptidase, partial [Aggregatilineaceae bacterium]|nr:M42 family metallopeptidase [Aggregatilineaceae bacterium]